MSDDLRRRWIARGCLAALTLGPAAMTAAVEKGSWLLTAATLFTASFAFLHGIEEFQPEPIRSHYRVIAWAGLTLGCAHEAWLLPERRAPMALCAVLLQVLAVWIWRVRRLPETGAGK